MFGTRKEFMGDTGRGPPLGTVEASEILATRWSVPRGGGHRATGITANRAQAGQLEVYTSCQDKGRCLSYSSWTHKQPTVRY